MEQVIANIAKMSVNGNRLELPKDDQFENYAKIKGVLQKAGGKYVKLGFVFSGCAQEIKDRLCGGETVNDKKKFQFFATPAVLAVQMAEILNVQEGETVLEPSGGDGALIKAVKASCEFPVNFYTMDIDPVRVANLRALENVVVEECDFLEFVKGNPGRYEKIIANPPFTKNQDIEHIQAMYDILAEGGCIVTIASCSWVTDMQKKHVAFRAWLNDINATIQKVDEGAFKESGTNVSTMLLIIRK